MDGVGSLCLACKPFDEYILLSCCNEDYSDEFLVSLISN